jgi:uncharacterized protein HemY
MGMFNEISQMEENMFNLLCAAYNATHLGYTGRTKQYLMALEEIEDEYYELTKTEFIQENAVRRLLVEVKKIEEARKNLDEVPK